MNVTLRTLLAGAGALAIAGSAHAMPNLGTKTESLDTTDRAVTPVWYGYYGYYSPYYYRPYYYRPYYHYRPYYYRPYYNYGYYGYYRPYYRYYRYNYNRYYYY